VDCQVLNDSLFIHSIGTFSSVYKAIDVYHYHYDNRSWREPSPSGESSSAAGCQPSSETPSDLQPAEAMKWTRELRDTWRDNSHYISGYDRTPGGTAKKVYVALKRIYMTSSPERIANELEIMEELR
jgi:cell division control protein 7